MARKRFEIEMESLDWKGRRIAADCGRILTDTPDHLLDDAGFHAVFDAYRACSISAHETSIFAREGRLDQAREALVRAQAARGPALRSANAWRKAVGLPPLKAATR